MKNVNHKKHKFLSFAAKTLCMSACAFAGFIIAGPLAALLGIISGFAGGFLLEKGLQNYPV